MGRRRAAAVLAVVLLVGAWLGAPAAAQQASAAPASATQLNYGSPQAAADALVTAAAAADRARLLQILGPGSQRLLGDPVENQRDTAAFAEHAREGLTLDRVNEATFVMRIGHNGWPFAVPIVRRAERWQFDTPAGVEEILARRIGENETSTIATCQAYAEAQWEYFNDGPRDASGIKKFAQKMLSTPGQKNGLYWATGPDEALSPLGPLVAGGQAVGYRVGSAGTPLAPFRGYIYRILKAQGPQAPGGRYRYVINGNMIGGFALVAYPARWGQTGVMSFIVNQQGRVYQKDLGPAGAERARSMVEYNPDPSWRPAGP